MLIRYLLIICSVLLFVLGIIIGYKLRPSCPEAKPGSEERVTVIHEKSQGGSVKETRIIEKRVEPVIVPPAPISRYTLGVTVDPSGLGVMMTYRLFEKIPISIGGYVIPNKSYGLAVTFTF